MTKFLILRISSRRKIEKLKDLGSKLGKIEMLPVQMSVQPREGNPRNVGGIYGPLLTESCCIPGPANIVPAPPQVSGLHQQFRERLQSALETSRGLTLTHSEEAPAVITIVNSSRVVSDIRRDLGRIHSNDFTNILLFY